MSTFSDDEDEMIHRLLDDDTVEGLLCGGNVPADLAPLAALVDAVRTIGESAAPAPSGALVALFDTGVPPATSSPDVTVGSLGSTRPHRRAGVLVAKAAGLSLSAKVVLGVSTAAAAITATGAAEVLPGPAREVVGRVIEVITPFEAPGVFDDGPPSGLEPSREDQEPAGNSRPSGVPPEPAGQLERPEAGGKTPPASPPTSAEPPVSPEAPVTTGNSSGPQAPTGGQAPDSVPSPTTSAPRASPPTTAPGGPGSHRPDAPSGAPTSSQTRSDTAGASDPPKGGRR